MPKLNRYFLYIPEGPALPAKYLAAAVPLLRAYALSQNGFALRVGPMVVKNRWDSETIKEALADESKKLYSKSLQVGLIPIQMKLKIF